MTTSLTKILMICLSFLFIISCEKDSDNDIDTSFTIQIKSSVNGEVVLNPSKAKYKKGETITIEAIADDNYSFTSWEGNIPDGVKNSIKILVVVEEDILLEPVFTLETSSSYTLNINFDSSKGTVDISPNKNEYQLGDVVILSAVPTDGYKFVRWEGDISKMLPNIELTMAESYNITCVFEETEDSNPTSDILFEFDGKYEVSSNKWIFDVNVLDKEKDAPIIDYDIKVDNQVVTYDDFFKKYHLEMSREDNATAFQISIKHSSFVEKTYTITPSNFPKVDNLSVEQLNNNESFIMTWVDVNADGYRITKQLFTESTSGTFIIVDFYNGLSKTFDKADIWASNFGSNQPVTKFWVWVNPVKRINDLNGTFSKESYIEIVGSRTHIIEGKR